GNDVILTCTAPPPPRVAAVAINGGAATRSVVTSLAVTFDAAATFAGPVAAAFALTRVGDGAAVAFAATPAVVNGVTVVTLSGFTEAATQSGSLADGRYTLTVLANRVTANGFRL